MNNPRPTGTPRWGHALVSPRWRAPLTQGLLYLGAVAAVFLGPVIISPDGMVRTLAQAGKPALDSQPVIMGVVVAAFGLLVIVSKLTPWRYPAGRKGAYELSRDWLSIGWSIVAQVTGTMLVTVLAAVLYGKASQFLTITFPVLRPYQTAVALLLLAGCGLIIQTPYLRSHTWQKGLKPVFTWVFLLAFGALLALVWWTIYRYSTQDQIDRIVEDVTLTPLVDKNSPANSATIFFSTICSGALAYAGLCLPNPDLGNKRVSPATQGIVQIVLAALGICALLALLVSAQISPHWLIAQGGSFILFDLTLLDSPQSWPLLSQLTHGALLGHPHVFRFALLLCTVFLVMGAGIATRYFSYSLRFFFSNLVETRLASALWRDNHGKTFTVPILVGTALMILISGADTQSLLVVLATLVFLNIFIEQIASAKFLTNRHSMENRGKSRQKLWRARLVNMIVAALCAVMLVAIFTVLAPISVYVLLLVLAVVSFLAWLVWRYYIITARLIHMSPNLTHPQQVGNSHALVMVSKMHLPSLRAIAWARQLHGQNLEIVSLQTSEKDTRQLREQWQKVGIDLPLTVLDTEHKRYTKALCDYIGHFTISPQDVVFVYFPHYRPTQHWTRILFNRSYLSLRKKLLSLPQVVVCAVPFELPINTRQVFTRYQDRLENTAAWENASEQNENTGQNRRAKAKKTVRS